MKSSVKKFLAVALVGGALFGATGAQARDWDRGNDRDHRGFDKKVVHVYKQQPVKHVYRHYNPRPQYVYHNRHDRYYTTKPGRFIIGFNF